MAFKVFDLQCEHGHVFEGWFSSHSDFDTQRERGLISCPLCDSKSIDKKLSAPATRDPGNAPMSPDMQAAMLKQLREVLRQTENVGERFATEARRIHHGDAPERPIRGVATQQERQSLAEEGIAVAPIPALLDDDRLQ